MQVSFSVEQYIEMTTALKTMYDIMHNLLADNEWELVQSINPIQFPHDHNAIALTLSDDADITVGELILAQSMEKLFKICDISNEPNSFLDTILDTLENLPGVIQIGL